ncbi:MAG TPA: DUF4389 domain-containing protein [Candidatus Nanoarchaeia archaeon]|nr:DUF4389 domain-containing protein [Candidatus Nanoarchaeia archaeon]
METVTSAKFNIKEEASRLELLIRIILGLIYGLVLSVISFVLSIVLFLQFFHILILGKRHERMAEFTKGYINYTMQVGAYLNYVTDERPPFWPEEL